MPQHELILLKNMMHPGYSGSLQDYQAAGGYQALQKVLAGMPPEDIINMVKQ